MPAFLFEIGLEEIPASMVVGAQAELAKRCRELIVRERLAGEGFEVKSFSTPRRMAVLVEGLLANQADMEEQVVGPSVAVAYKNGAPTPAAIAFAKKSDVEVSALETIQNAKGEYVAAIVRRPGRSAADVLTSLLPAELAAIYWPKSMYWRAGRPERFVRPVRWLVALLDAEILPVEFAGVTAGNVSYGHRVLHGSEPVTISAPDKYSAALKAAFVEVDPEARRHRIRKALDAITRQIPGARWREDEALVEAVTNLTEWPSVILGSFDPLGLPDEVLVTVMRDHQKYFALEDADRKLLPNFLAVRNIEVNAAGEEIIRHGNERVLRARFNDARFFWDVDQKISLEKRVEMLKNVTFQKDLGSYWDKTQANTRIANEIAQRVIEAGGVVDEAALQVAVRVAKADLTTELVKEFTELQGTVGGLYARHENLLETAAQAIYWQYRPASAEDAIPPTVEGQILGLADRMNTIVDMFAIGLGPTGSKDPFGLRRAGNAVVKILAESDLPLFLKDVTEPALGHLSQSNLIDVKTAIERFLVERISFYLRDVLDFPYDTVNAVIAAGTYSIRGAIRRGEAAEEIRKDPDFLALCLTAKRIRNILLQAESNGLTASLSFDSSLAEYGAERNFCHKVADLSPKVEQLRRNHSYLEALRATATLRPVIDLFFEDVMVMAPDPKLRRNRLALLSKVQEDFFKKILDFSQIVVAGT